VILGAVWGLAVATKVNAVFVMLALFLWAYIYQRQSALFTQMVRASFIAFPVFVISWPWLYPAPLLRIYEYVRWVTVDHWKIGQYYLHEFHMPLPGISHS
jgi:hypothetical protein